MCVCTVIIIILNTIMGLGQQEGSSRSSRSRPTMRLELGLVRVAPTRMYDYVCVYVRMCACVRACVRVYVAT